MDRISPLQVPSINRSRSPSPNRDPRPLYFAYGSNLWRQQMKQRCPSSQIIGIARLRHWKWQINTKGYANIVENPAEPSSPSVSRWLGPLGGESRKDSDRVYGIVYRLEKDDEMALERSQEETIGYSKEDAMVEFWARAQDSTGNWMKADLRNGRIQRVRVMMFVDRNDTSDGKAGGEYLYKLQAGVRDGVAEGIPQKYFDDYMKSYLPKEDASADLSLAIQEAIKKGVDVRRLVETAEKQLTTNGHSEPAQANL